jgi:hypothetical protein
MKWLAAILTWWSADPQAIDTERPRAAACVMAAHASMAREIKEDAAEDTNADAALGEPGAGLAAAARRQQPTDSSGTRLLRQEAQSVEAGCPDGSCVAVPSVRSRVLRTR